MVIHLLDQDGALHMDDPVAEYIPDFAAHGKHTTTLRDLLTHRAGIPSVPGSRKEPEMLLDVPRVEYLQWYAMDPSRKIDSLSLAIAGRRH